MPAMSNLTILERLIGFDTVSRTSNLALIDFIGNYLEGFGIKPMLVHNAQGDRANLYATIGPDDIGGILLSGHTDVVPVTGQSWDSDPFKSEERDGLLYGRGSSDMKGFIANALAAVPAMAAKKLHTPIHLAFSYDEEIGCVGARQLVEQMQPLAVKPRLGIIGEPTRMRSIIGHKGKRSFEAVINGYSCHSAYINEGVNAVEYAAKLIVFIEEMNQRLIDRGQTESGYSVASSTFHTGTITGGTALNIVPKQCRFEFEIRNLPNDDMNAIVGEIQAYIDSELLPVMQARQPDSGIELVVKSDYPGLHTHQSGECVGLVDAINEHACEGDKVSFGTEAGLFQEFLDMDCVVCGPGSIEQAHKPNEFVSLAQLAESEQFLQRLIARC